jgi:hypothetical protein
MVDNWRRGTTLYCAGNHSDSKGEEGGKYEAFDTLDYHRFACIHAHTTDRVAAISVRVHERSGITVNNLTI